MKAESNINMPRVVAALLVTCAMPVMLAGEALAQGKGPERRPIWYEGTVVSGLATPNESAADRGPEDLPQHVLQPFYFIITPGLGRVQDAVIGVIPGDIGYTGWWEFSALLDFSGRDPEADPYTSVGEIASALCQVPGFPGNIGTCIANGTPLVDVTGQGGQTDFTINVPIVMSPPNPAVCRN